MQPPELLRTLALGSSNENVISALLSQRSDWLNTDLALNKNLTVPQRNQLLVVARTDPKLESQLISHLAATARGDAQLKQLLRYPRQIAKDHLFTYGLQGASDALLGRIIPKLTPYHASRWLASVNPPPTNYHLAVAKIENSSTMLTLAANPATYTLAQAAEILNTVDLRPRATNHTSFISLIDHRPELAPSYLQLARNRQQKLIHPATIFDALATSRHIFTSFDFQSLIHCSRVLKPPLRQKFLMVLAQHPNIDTQALWEIRRLVKASRAKPSTARLRTVEWLYDYKYDHPERVVTSDWATLQDPQQLAAVAKYVDSAVGGAYRYPSLYKNHSTPQPAAKQSLPAEENSPLTALEDYYLTLPIDEHEGPRSHRATISSLAFNELLLPKLAQLGEGALQLFFSLSLGWRASVADLLQTTENSLSA